MPTEVMNSEIEEEVTSVSDDLGLLRELLADDLIAQRPKKSRKPSAGIDDMTPDEFRAYKARLQAERRAQIREHEAAGSLPFDSETTREALADAALMLLYSGRLGADAVMNYLGLVFKHKPGAPLTIMSSIRSGALKPKLVHVAGKAR